MDQVKVVWIALVLSFGMPALLGQEAYLLRELKAERHVVVNGGYFPRVVALKGGDLLATYKYDAPHVGKGGKAGISRSRDGGVTWSKTQLLFDIPDADDGADASGAFADDTVMFGMVSYTWKGEKYSHEGWSADVHFMKSLDSGRTWEEPVKVNIAPFTWGYPFGTILRQDDGTILMAGYGGYLPRVPEDSEAGLKKLLAEGKKPFKPPEARGMFAFIVRSRDGGKTWGDVTTIARRMNEVSILRRRDGTLLAMTRSDAGGYLASSTSSDPGGYHWSEPVRITKTREHPADLLRLQSGHILLTYGVRNKPYGVQAMITRDEGKTWRHSERVMLAWDGDHSDLGYPVTVQRADGKLVTVYYIVYGESDREGTKGFAMDNAFTKAVIWEPPDGW